MILTPKRLSLLSEFYSQLSRLLSAGVGLIQALQNIQKTAPRGFLRKSLRTTINYLNQGYMLAESLDLSGRWLPAFDIALIRAGERSGHLDACLDLLADYYGERARLVRKVIGQLAYPVLILHFFVMIFPTNLLVALILHGRVTDFLWYKLTVLLPLYAAVFVLVFASQGQRGELCRAWMERILNWIPILGKARRDLALARLSATLGASISAGITIIEAWDLAAEASGSPALGRAVAAAKPRILAGELPSEAINSQKVFPDVFTGLYSSGEISGKLDQTLARLHKLYQEDGTHKLQTFAEWAPKVFYFVIMGVIAYQVIKFWTGYFDAALDTGF